MHPAASPFVAGKYALKTIIHQYQFFLVARRAFCLLHPLRIASDKTSGMGAGADLERLGLVRFSF